MDESEEAPKPPFDAGIILSLFMDNIHSGSVAGDLEERFQRICAAKGRVRATIWFCLQFARSLPLFVIAALRRTQGRRPVAINLAVSDSLSLKDSLQRHVFDACQNPGECYGGTIGWCWKDDLGTVAGTCDSCGTFHIKCGNCGELSYYHEDRTVQCDGCEVRWELSLEDGHPAEFERLSSDEANDEP
jgi:hypothetical protein